MGKRGQMSGTKQTSPSGDRRILTLYQRQLSRQQAKIAALTKQVATQELRLRILHGLRRASTATFEMDSLLPVLLEMVLETMVADYGVLLQVDTTENVVLFGVQRGKDGSATPLTHVPLTLGYRRRLLTNGRPPLIRMVKTPPQGWVIPKGRGRPMSLLVVPLEASGRVVGLLELARIPPTPPFRQRDARILTAIGHQLGIVMENARLYFQAERRVGQLSTLMELSTILNSTLQRQEVLRRAMEAATRLMECEVGSLLLVDEERNELVFEVALGERGEVVKEIRLKIGEGIAGWVAQSGEPAIVNDVRQDPRFAHRVDAQSQFITRNMICVPVTSRGKIIGVLQAINRIGDRRFTREDLDLFLSLSNQVAIAVENAKLYEEVKATFFSTAETLAEAIEKRDPYTGGHVRRVVEISLAIGETLGLGPQEMETLHLVAILHDVGKIGIRDHVLLKEGPLDPEEMAHMQLHPQLGAEILAPIRQLKAVIPAVQYHQERYDGFGYPEGLRGEEIPIAARIIAVADTFDAMTTDRPYRRRFDDEAAVREIHRCAGTQFDPKVVEAFTQAYRSGRIKSEASVSPGEDREVKRGLSLNLELFEGVR